MRKILVIGHARHGKDTAAEFLAKILDLNYRGSSEVCAEFIFEELGCYSTVQECFNDRSNHRAAWHQLIAKYCKDDKARLGKLIYRDNDIYCGVRAQDELDSVIAEFNPLVLWVDASERLPLEPSDSMQLSYEPRFNFIDNNKSKGWMLKQLTRLAHLIDSTKGSLE